MCKSTPFALIVERFIVEEKLREIAAQPTGNVTIRGLSYATAKNYMSNFYTHLLPRWGEMPLDSIRPLDVLHWLKELDLCVSTKSSLKALMHNMFEKAMLWELLDYQRNPIDLVKIKGIKGRKKKKRVVLTVEQFHALLADMPEPYRTMVNVAVCTGLRVSEVLALRWEHIQDGALLVQASCYKGRIGAVKTEASQDEIPVHPEILSGLTPMAEGLLFPCRTGECFNGNMIQQRWIRPAGRKMGIETLGWHALRHTYRSLLDEIGATVGVQQKLMRHANVATTMNVYGASAMKAKRDANDKVVEMVVRRVG